MPNITSADKVLVTGANGYVALWIIQYLLQSGYAVRGTVRSESKESHARRYFEDLGLGQKLEFVVVDDITKPRSFDEAVVGVDAIVHTASPFHLSPKDVNDLYDPAIKGTTRILESALTSSRVKRVVVTSSTAAVTSGLGGAIGRMSEENWNETSASLVESVGYDRVTGGDIYRAAKTLAEQAAWKWYEKHRGEIGWDLTVLNPPWVFGPPIQDVNAPETLNTSMFVWWSNVLAHETKSKEQLSQSDSWVDVRDVARAHVLALEKDEAGGQRIIIASGPWRWQEWIDIAKHVQPLVCPKRKISPGFPEILDELKGVPYDDDYDNGKGVKLLGISYRTKEETAKDILEDFTRRGW